MFKSFSRWVGDSFVDSFADRLLEDKYTENLFNIYSYASKLGVREIMETMLRSSQGKPISRPMGSPVVLSPWYDILFNPVHFVRMPTTEEVEIDTSVVIGKQSRKPLKLDFPVMIAGMSFGGALSEKAKIALAKGASEVGTATNTGEAPLLESERRAAKYLIGQYNRGGWLNDPEQLKQLDAIEIQVGQGAQASAPQRTQDKNIHEDFRKEFHLKEGQDAVIHSRLPGIDTPEKLSALVDDLRNKYGVPVGIKFAASNYLEAELDILTRCNIDFIAVDGAEGGTHGGPTILQDDMGLPTLTALIRASNYLKNKNLKERISLIITGGLTTPGHFLKALALGADAVYIGSIALISLLQDQITKSVIWEPPTELLLYSGKRKEELDIEKASHSLANFLKSCKKEIQSAVMAMGKASVNDVNRQDLCTINRDVSRLANIAYVYNYPEIDGTRADYGAGIHPFAGPEAKREQAPPPVH